MKFSIIPINRNNTAIALSLFVKITVFFSKI